LSSELELIVKVAASSLLGGLLGFERERKRKPAGLRTNMLVSLGSTLFTILSTQAFPGSDPARVASYIVVGIGFIGAGAIIQSKDRVIGITTASSLWIASAIGMAVGVGYYLAACLVTAVAFAALLSGRLERKQASLENRRAEG
jgi:putative Mg2+ transporter-C (MgtC) family protein